MSPEFLAYLSWSLLPMAVASGWYLARVRSPLRKRRLSAASLTYVRGVNFLLDEQPDKAIDVFLKGLEVEGETLETHLALGNLFRRRGEVERAIRIHQHVVAHPSINEQQRALGLLELGMDYMCSGLYDRAEGLFKELVQADLHVCKALHQLLEIYQQERDWDRAIACAKQIESRCGEDLQSVKAHYLCELVEQCISQGDQAQARTLIRKALAIDPNCARASLIEGRLAQSVGDLDAAVAALERLEHQDQAFLGEALGPLRECHARRGSLYALMDYLGALDLNRVGIAPRLLRAELLAERKGIEEAIADLGGVLGRRPSLIGLDCLIDLSIRSRQCLPQSQVAVLKTLTAGLLRDRSNYRCGHCGFIARRIQWQCPGCGHWGTVRPILDVESA